MANGHVEIHDPLSDHNNLSNGTGDDLKSTSDTDSMEDTVEFRILMAYAKRRRPKKDAEPTTPGDLVAQNGDARVNGPSSPQTPPKTETEVKGEKKKKKKKGIKRLLRMLNCFKPQIDEPSQTPANTPTVLDRSADPRDEAESEVTKEDELDEVAARLVEIADEIPFVPCLPEIEADAPEDEDEDEVDDVEKVVGLLLRERGDHLNEELKGVNVARELFLNYDFYKRLMTMLLIRMGLMSPEPSSLGPQSSPKTLIAVACEATRRLSAVETLPINRMLDHGARYLRDYFSSWVQQQGGYEEAFHIEDDEDEVQ